MNASRLPAWLAKTRRLITSAKEKPRKLLGVRGIERRMQQGRISRDSYYNALTDRIMRRRLHADSVCVDVGCHCGSILAIMKQYAPNGQFFAFEPIPHLYAGLVRKFADGNTHLYELALSNTKETATFKHVVSNPGYSGLRERLYDRPEEKIEQLMVQTDRLDDVLRRMGSPPVDFIKIDVEGAEHLVMKGAERCIQTHRPIIVFEFGERSNGCYGVSPGGVFDYITNRLALRVSLLSDYLLGKAALTSRRFCEHYHQGSEYYFVAHPD